jgi:OOP family OmpA-OmpF porin
MAGLVAWAATAAVAAVIATEPKAEEVDLLTFAQGAFPLRVEADDAAKVTMEYAIAAIDGSATVRPVTSTVDANTRLAFVYELPALTRFERLRVPGVLETPSPRQTFVRDVTVRGSAVSSTEGFVKLASAMLTAHPQRGQYSELTVHRHDEVRWVKLELAHALSAPQPKVWLEFSEIIGHGRQQPAALATGFGGHWQGRGLALSLRQEGALVSGCYDRGGRLEGTVNGRMLYATGREPRTGVPSSFIAALGGDGALQLLRSTNGAPFKLYAGQAGTPSPGCEPAAKPALGCGSVIHGIRFDFDSAVVRPEAGLLLDMLYQGLAADKSACIRIEGHTSSEGEAAYNQGLSQRRAQAVARQLEQRGLAGGRVAGVGLGETRPIAPNDDEAGRALNRRVEVHCQG